MFIPKFKSLVPTYGSYKYTFLTKLLISLANSNALEFLMSDVFSLNVAPRNKIFVFEISILC